MNQRCSLRAGTPRVRHAFGCPLRHIVARKRGTRAKAKTCQNVYALQFPPRTHSGLAWKQAGARTRRSLCNFRARSEPTFRQGRAAPTCAGHWPVPIGEAAAAARMPLQDRAGNTHAARQRTRPPHDARRSGRPPSFVGELLAFFGHCKGPHIPAAGTHEAGHVGATTLLTRALVDPAVSHQ